MPSTAPHTSTTAAACNVGRIRAEERFLATGTEYASYQAAVRWRLVPGIW